MSKKGENIYKRKDGRWEGRYIKFYDGDGKAKYGYLYGKTYTEVKAKLRDIQSDLNKGVLPKSQSTVMYGAEFADFAQCESWGTEVFFSHPYTSWERPQNERHNGLFRAFVPKGTSMQNYSAEYILSAADELNARPRKKLGYATPEELFDSFLDRVYAVDSKPA